MSLVSYLVFDEADRMVFLVLRCSSPCSAFFPYPFFLSSVWGPKEVRSLVGHGIRASNSPDCPRVLPSSCRMLDCGSCSFVVLLVGVGVRWFVCFCFVLVVFVCSFGGA